MMLSHDEEHMNVCKVRIVSIFKKMAHKRKKLDALGRQNQFNINNKKHIIIEITKILQRNINIFFSLVQTNLS